MKPSDPLLPVRHSLVSDCVRVMKTRIAAGEWSGVLPGERRLAGLLNVGRDTVRLALAELAAEGVISDGLAGKRREILRKGGNGKDRRATLRIGMLSPYTLERMSQSMLAEVDQVRSLLAQRGGSLTVFSPPWYDSRGAGSRLVSLLGSQHCDAWILYRSSREIQEYFQSSHTPCVIRGHPHPGVVLPYMDYDWNATGRHAVGELWRKGHRRIGLVLPQDGLRGNIAAWNGAKSFAEPGVEYIEIWDDGSNQGLVAALTGAICGPRAPTAFITLRPRQTITLITWLASRGWRVPDDFSLISLATEPMLSHVVPAITSYHNESSVFAKRVARHLELLAGGRIGPQTNLLLMPDLVPGGSIKAV